VAAFDGLVDHFDSIVMPQGGQTFSGLALAAQEVGDRVNVSASGTARGCDEFVSMGKVASEEHSPPRLQGNQPLAMGALGEGQKCIA